MYFEEKKFWYHKDFGVFTTDHFNSLTIGLGSDIANDAGITKDTSNDKVFELLREYLEKLEVKKSTAHRLSKKVE